MNSRNFFLVFPIVAASVCFGQTSLSEAKQALADHVDKNAKLAQVMVDTVFSFAELGFQEIETSKYLTGILEKNGFKIERGIAGIPTAWIATWGEGKPIIALGSDIDCIPQASQKPGVAWHEPIIPGAPGHGEGHNSGEPLNILAALAVKDLMVKNHLRGTIKIWPGVAEELLGTKAFYVRDGYFKDVDAVLFAHVFYDLGALGGEGPGTGLISVQYNFHGESAHAAAAPWRGRSALDAVELMDTGWNFHREHLRPQQRSHYVITNGGDQPNVVPPNASVWYYFRELDYDHIKSLWDDGDRMAKGAALMTQTTWDSTVLGSAWPSGPMTIRHWPKPCRKNWGLRRKVSIQPSSLPNHRPLAAPQEWALTISGISPGMCPPSFSTTRLTSQVYPVTTGQTLSPWRLPLHTRGL
jgi:aminobenzoyl-glutamate utilization protein B